MNKMQKITFIGSIVALVAFSVVSVSANGRNYKEHRKVELSCTPTPDVSPSEIPTPFACTGDDYSSCTANWETSSLDCVCKPQDTPMPEATPTTVQPSETPTQGPTVTSAPGPTSTPTPEIVATPTAGASATVVQMLAAPGTGRAK